MKEKNGISYEFMDGKIESIKKYVHGEAHLCMHFLRTIILVFLIMELKCTLVNMKVYVSGYVKSGKGLEYDKMGTR